MSKIFMLSWAQNNTEVHAEFWENMKAYRKKRRATLLIHSAKYNPGYNAATHRLDNKDEGLWWAKEVTPYLQETDCKLSDKITFYAECEVRATTEKPLSGKAGWGGSSGGIFGHPKWQMNTYSVPGAKYPKLQQTTGAVTKKNYSESNAGRKAHDNHFFGFTVVEIGDDGYYHTRRVHACGESGNFYDTFGGYVYYTSSGKTTRYEGTTAALMVGDSHVEETCESAVQATREMIKTLKPEKMLGNDIISVSARNKHEKHKVFSNWWKHYQGLDNLESDLHNSVALIKSLGLTHMIQSNHHDHLDQYCDDSCGHSDLINAKLWHELNYLRRKTGLSAYQAWIEHHYPEMKSLVWTSPENTLTVLGTFFCHGDKGPNGAKGMRSKAHTLGRNIVQAHTHDPWGLGNANGVGHTSLYQHGYNDASLSGWLQGNGVLYPDGKFQHLHIIKDSKNLWRL